jgi:hypothetical protein
MIDVVNEAVGTHQPGNPMIKESLGGGGKTGYDWLIKAYEMAFERFPNSILIYNDFNTFQWNTDEYIDLVRTLRDAGAPIDAYGCQSHDVGDISETNLKNVLKKLQDGLKMPMYITELDISKENDAQQKAQYQKVFPLMWESPYCAGVTLWGWIYGQTWDQAKYSGLIKNGKERSALTWIKDYMASDVAKNAKSPYPGMKKRLSVFVKPLALKVAKGDVLPIKVRTYITDAAKEEKADYAIDKVELYDGNDLIATMTEEPYIAEYTASTAGTKTLKAIVYTNDGNTHERYSRVTVLSSTTKREPYNETIPELPGTINMIEYDKGESGVSYNKFSRSATAVTQNDGWAEYTVDVKEDGIYSFDAEVASTKTGGAFHISEYTLDNLNFLSEFIEVPKTGSASDFQTIHGLLQAPLTAGRHVLCLNIEKGGFYIKNLTFSRYEEDKTMTCTVSRTPTTITIGDKATITVTAKSNTSTIANVKIYANNLLISTLTEPTSDSNYVFEYEPTTAGSQVIKAIITDAEGKSKTSSNVTLTVNTKREPYSSMTIPGTIQAENYDKGGANKAYKDNETENRGDANFRTDEGVDIVKGNGGRALGYTAKGEWVEYTIDVKQAGTYDYTATVSSGTTGSGFSINVNKNGSITKLADISVPQTGNNSWDTYKTMKGTLSKSLEAGQQIIRIVITGDNCNIDMIQFTANETGINSVTIDESSEEALYNLSGQKVDANYRGIIIQNGKKRLNK